ncbi:hypothetical protein OH77DRAFT_1462169 [Trametes cingulata]|nr:hypothetical protein OH77DRAFT_1462169 [Trametes cingulata]
MDLRLVHDVVCNFDERILQHESLNFPNLVLLRYEVCYDHRNPPEFDEVFSEAQRWLKEYPRETLQRRVEENDAACMFEACLRKMATCEPGPESLSDLIEHFERLSSNMVTLGPHEGEYDSNKPPVKNNTPELQRRATAAWAWCYFSSFFIMDPGASFRTLSKLPIMANAACCADACARDSFLPPIVTRIGTWLATVHARYGVPIGTLPAFKEFKALWMSFLLYRTLSIERDLDWHEKSDKAPNKYQCAADGCGVYAMNRAALRRCGGNCPPESKPHYCSYWCQEQHWFVHRYVCKDGLSGDSVIVDDDGDPEWEDIDEYDSYHYDSALFDDEVWALEPGNELFVDIEHPSPYRKGEIFRVRSKTLSADFLRSYRNLWKLPSYRRKYKEEDLCAFLP